MAEIDALTDSIAIHRRRHVNGTRVVNIVVLELPTPLFATECYFVAFAFSDDGMGHYFTLERHNTNSPQTKFCAWDREGRHLNYGDGPPPDVDSFVRAVGQKLCRGEPPATV